MGFLWGETFEELAVVLSVILSLSKVVRTAQQSPHDKFKEGDGGDEEGVGEHDLTIPPPYPPPSCEFIRFLHRFQ